MQPTVPSLSGRRVLVVDDEFFVAVHIETLLEDFGCEVVGPVATIEEALALVGSEKLDGALLDANLNGISSAPIAAELRDRAIPFLVITGYGQLALADAALNSAPRLSKPFDTAGLEKALAAMLGA
ncbi:hypothetical protein BH10PSE6_BH10PSE6_19550 [soil metagenome]